MKTKLSKEELLRELSEIEKQEQEERNLKFYKKYKDLNFFKFWFKIIDWRYLSLLFSIIIIFSLLTYQLICIILIPLLILASIPLEKYNRLMILKKKYKK